MKHHINDMKRRALHNADAAYYVLDYLAHSFPVQLYEPFTDSEGNLSSRPVKRDGQPVECREAARRREAPRGGAPESGIRGFRDVVADANDLGRASQQASRTARRTLADSQGGNFERKAEPSLNHRGGLAYDDDQGQNYGQANDYDPSLADERYRPAPPPAPPRGGQRESFDRNPRKGKSKSLPWKNMIGGPLPRPANPPPIIFVQGCALHLPLRGLPSNDSRWPPRGGAGAGAGRSRAAASPRRCATWPPADWCWSS